MVCMNSTTVYLMEQAVCRKHYFEVQPALVQPGGLVDEEICKLPDIQSQVASINGTYRMLVMMPGEVDSPCCCQFPGTDLLLALFLTGPWGRVAGILGKRWVLLLNLSSTTFGAMWFASVCKHHINHTL